jgi:beta-glucanase (GH16 family)
MPLQSKSALWPGIVIGAVLVAATTFLVARADHAAGTASSAISSHSTRASARSHSPAPISSSGLPTGSASRWLLTWQDDFSTAAGLSQWWYESGNVGGPSLGQLQWYDQGNATISHGNLLLTATASDTGHQCWNGPCQYTSVRMQSYFSQAYGLFEARIKLAGGTGIWPAFWMQGANYDQVGLPQAGEIDIAEVNGQAPVDRLGGYAHAPDVFYTAYDMMTQPVYSGYHIYAVDWTPTGITWLLDGKPFGYMAAYPGWPFNHPFNIILDLAVGGNWPGPPNASTQFPVSMYVNWVRVYRQT